MTPNLFETQYDVTKKSKLKKFYEKNKILIFSLIFSFFFITGALFLYFEKKDKKNIELSENYIEAKMNIENKEYIKAKEILTKIIYENNPTYSSMSLFLILNKNLIEDKKELEKLFEHILENNRFDEEIKNLIVFKKILFKSDSSTEQELLELTKPLLNSNTSWKPHVLLLMGDYFVSKKEFTKAKEFYEQILRIKNLQNELYDQAKYQLILINSK